MVETKLQTGAGIELTSQALFPNQKLFDNKKAFKVRLTSKSSGKKIDINVAFRTKKVPTHFSIYGANLPFFIPFYGGIPEGMLGSPLGPFDLEKALEDSGLGKLD